MRHRSKAKLRWSVLGALLMLAASSAPALAATAWTVATVRGTAFALVGSKWEEIAKGQELVGEQVIRTLQSGRVQLDAPEGRLELGAGTAIQIDASSVTQFSGTVTVQSAPGSSLVVVANDVVATVTGKATLRFDGDDVSIKVAGGTVKVADASDGEIVNLVAGQSLEVSETGVLTASVGGSANAAGGNPNANPNAGANGNAGGNGNSGGSGENNAGGNGNGNAGGNGNSGGSGDNNAGGNGNGGGSGNSNAGGNGNGNGKNN
jgi:hypothetical protein